MSSELKTVTKTIVDTFTSFGVSMGVTESYEGITYYHIYLTPKKPVRMHEVTSYLDDLRFALGTHVLKIEAPVKNTQLIGIQVLRKNREYNIDWSKYPDQKPSAGALVASLGITEKKERIECDVAELSHLLIGGRSNTGKTTFIHRLITTLIAKNDPASLRLMLADNGDKDGFKLYTGLPHLLTAPINETTRTLSALRWANKEMERRYEILESAGVEDFAEYRQKIPLQLRMDDPLPVVLVVIDEIADLMSDYGDDADKLLRRLAMMSCGVGIHLVLSTASYEPRILRATLSANIPSVLCFSVDTAEVSDLFVYDSGAEELIGKGSALVTTPNIFPATPVYTQGITTQEVKQCVLNVKRKYGAVDEDGIDLKKLSDYKFELFSFEEDELYQDAKEAVIEAGKASTSYLQRRLRVGYSRAARLIDMLEERGVIGPQDGSSPREVLE